MNAFAPPAGAPANAGDALARAARSLAAAGVDGARRDARLLLQEAAGITAEALFAHPEHALTRGQTRWFDRLLARRRAREPVSRILARREFWGLDFAVAPATLDPRPDSEALIHAALDTIADRAAPCRVLDLGTGSGCLLLALLSELPAAHGVGCDMSEAALRVARANAASLGLSLRAAFTVGDWARPVGGTFDVILANPPYIPAPAIAGLAPEVRDFDPRLALDGGADGLAAYRAIARQLGPRLALQGRAIIETGDGQAAQVAAILAAHGLAVARPVLDLAGRERCIIASAPANIAGLSKKMVDCHAASD